MNSFNYRYHMQFAADSVHHAR